MRDEVSLDEPGGGSSQSENVRTGILLRTDDGAAARRRLLPIASSRTWRSDRSIVDALMASTAARICGPSLMCPCRSIASTNVGISAFRRLPQIRSDASHRTTIASQTDSS